MTTLAMATLFCVAVLAFVSKNTSDAKISLGVFSEDPEISTLISLVSNMDLLSQNTNIILVDSLEGGLLKLTDYNILALAHVNHDLVESILRGENNPATIYLNDTFDDNNIAISSLKNSFSSLLNEVQRHIYTTINIAQKNNVEIDIIDLNIEFVTSILSSNDKFEEIPLFLGSNLPLFQHILVSFWIFFVVLTTGIFYDEIQLRSDILNIKLLSMHTKFANLIFTSKIILLFILYFLLFILPLFFIGFTTLRIIGILLFTTCFMSLQIAFFNVFSEKTSALTTNFLTNTVLFYLSGAFIPQSFLPKIIQNLGSFLPQFHFINSYSPTISTFLALSFLSVFIFLILKLVVFRRIYNES